MQITKLRIRRDRRRHAGRCVAGCLPLAQADAVTDWNLKADELVAEAKLGTPPAIRVMAIVQTAVADAVGRSPAGTASVEAAVAAANRADAGASCCRRSRPRSTPPTRRRWRGIADGPAKDAGIAIGERAAAARARRACRRRRRRRAGLPAAHQRRRLRADGDAGDPAVVAAQALADGQRGAVPARPAAGAEQRATGHATTTRSRHWAARRSTRRSAEQTEIARFWEYSLPAIYYGVVRSVALQPGRDLARNARLYAAVAQAMDDAMISVFDAKYHYHFWRPVTAIRNGDIDGNDATAARRGAGRR